VKRKIGVVSALAVLATNVGMSTPVLSQETYASLAACEAYMQMGDRAILQEELARLLVADPNNICIDLIVDLLGGSPVAQVPQVDPY
jgi:hypothetical protein